MKVLGSKHLDHQKWPYVVKLVVGAVVKLSAFRPLASSLLGRLQSWLNGMRPEFIESLSSLQRARGERRDQPLHLFAPARSLLHHRILSTRWRACSPLAR